INVLADNALLSGFATGQRPVTRQLVVEVCRDFDLRGSGIEPPEAEVEVPAPIQAAEPPPSAPAKILALETPSAARAPAAAEAELTAEEPAMFASTKKRWSFFS